MALKKNAALQKNLVRIGELAAMTDLTPQTIRYYEDLGLIGPGKREGNGHRQYGEEAVTRLSRISVLKSLGLSLEEIRDVIDLYSENADMRGKRKVLTLLQTQEKEVVEKIAALEGFLVEVRTNIERMESYIKDAKAVKD